MVVCGQWTTGDNEFGQLGDGTASFKSSFVLVISSGAEAIATGYDHSMVLKQDGSVWATGRNTFGQLGNIYNGPINFWGTFVQVISSGVQGVAAGGWHSMIIKHDGSLWATGANIYGQLGDGSTIDRSTYVRVLSPRDGAWFTVAL